MFGPNKTLLVVIAILIVAIAGVFVFRPRPATAPTTPTTPPAPTASGPATFIISMDTSGFVPSALTIKVGDTVIFKNNDTRQRWPASAVHPTHLVCPGFDALEPLSFGASYSHTFTEAKECPFHDHLIPSLKGGITILP